MHPSLDARTSAPGDRLERVVMSGSRRGCCAVTRLFWPVHPVIEGVERYEVGARIAALMCERGCSLLRPQMGWAPHRELRKLQLLSSISEANGDQFNWQTCWTLECSSNCQLAARYPVSLGTIQRRCPNSCRVTSLLACIDCAAGGLQPLLNSAHVAFL